jgi:hypothetical protein
MSTQSTSLDDYLSDLENFVDSTNSDFTSALSDFLDQVKNQPLSEAERLKKLTDFYEQQYRDMQSSGL